MSEGPRRSGPSLTRAPGLMRPRGREIGRGAKKPRRAHTHCFLAEESQRILRE